MPVKARCWVLFVPVRLINIHQLSTVVNIPFMSGPWSAADPLPMLPAASNGLVAIIRSLDGRWHCPFTTFEPAGLQGLTGPEQQLELN